MICPECESSTLKIYDSRHTTYAVVRKRNCISCGFRFYTTENYMSEEQLAELQQGGYAYDAGSSSKKESQGDFRCP